MNSERRIVEKEIHRFALNDKLMVNCQWLIVIGKRKVLRVFIFHFSLFTFRSFMCICVHSRSFAKFAFG